MDDFDVAGEPPSSPPAHGHSGITLVLPSLRALKAANASKKSKPKNASAEAEQRPAGPPKPPRPIKLKPLKEVLTKLIAQIKKKDDYAFFIHPVNPAQVPGYADAIKNPMDFGTMTTKVAKGKYRSLDEFSADFRLVTANAKTFNPPGSIYHSEADRLEAWGLDHIARATAHVIEFETDWNIDVEQDEDASTSQLVNIDDEVSTPRDLDGSMAAGSRAASMTPAPGQAPTIWQGRRGARGPYKKQTQAGMSESLDAEGRMPGLKDGVGVFPPGSDWAELMIALKIKGKRYKTKKERLRFEKEGPPYLADGSLDYTEMEDPYSVLNVFAPEAPSRPQVSPLYPPTTTIATDGAHHQPRMSELRIHAPTPVTVPPNRPPPVLSTLSNIPTLATMVPSTSGPPPPRPAKRRRHWTIVRNVTARSRAKDKEADGAVDEAKTSWKVSRDAGPAEYGTFATFLGELAASAEGQNAGATVGSVGNGAADYIYGSEQRLFATIRSTVEHRGVGRKCEGGHDEACKKEEEEERKAAGIFWTDERAEEGWDYLRDVVYGGVDGYAYVRSLAEFVGPSAYLADVRKAEDSDGEEEEEEEEEKGGMGEGDEKSASTPSERDGAVHPLGVPLARYIEDNLVDMVTRGRHGWLRDVVLPDDGSSPFHVRLAALPGVARDMASSGRWSGEHLDMAALIREPEELAQESVLEGGGGERAEIERALAWSAETIKELAGREKEEGGGRGKKREVVNVKEEEEEEEEEEAMEVDVDAVPDARTEEEPEDPLLKRLRMNLLALAKRAPLDSIAKLPVELVPEDIRGIVPTA